MVVVGGCPPIHWEDITACPWIVEQTILSRAKPVWELGGCGGHQTPPQQVLHSARSLTIPLAQEHKEREERQCHWRSQLGRVRIGTLLLCPPL